MRDTSEPTLVKKVAWVQRKFEMLLYAEVLVEAIYKKKPCVLTCREL